MQEISLINSFIKEATMLTVKKIGILTVAFVLVAVFSGGTWAKETNKININTASIEELVQLKRVGGKYAKKIVEFRKANGPFKSVEEITKVPGIGPKTLTLNSDRIVVK